MKREKLSKWVSEDPNQKPTPTPPSGKQPSNLVRRAEEDSVANNDSILDDSQPPEAKVNTLIRILEKGNQGFSRSPETRSKTKSSNKIKKISSPISVNQTSKKSAKKAKKVVEEPQNIDVEPETDSGEVGREDSPRSRRARQRRMRGRSRSLTPTRSPPPERRRSRSRDCSPNQLIDEFYGAQEEEKGYDGPGEGAMEEEGEDNATEVYDDPGSPAKYLEESGATDDGGVAGNHLNGAIYHQVSDFSKISIF